MYLNLYRQNMEKIEEYNRKIADYERRSTRIATFNGGEAKVDKSKPLNAPFERDIYRALEVKRQRDLYIQDITPLMERIRKSIEEVEPWELQWILLAHYIDGKSWNQILSEYKYSRATLMRKHNEALSKIKVD